jgi:hypothetical protein
MFTTQRISLFLVHQTFFATPPRDAEVVCQTDLDVIIAIKSKCAR